MGCAMPQGTTGYNIGRMAALASGLPVQVAGMSVDRQCASGMMAIATAAMLYGLSSGAALATVVGVLIEVPLMLALVRFCLNTQGWFQNSSASANVRSQT